MAKQTNRPKRALTAAQSETLIEAAADNDALLELLGAVLAGVEEGESEGFEIDKVLRQARALAFRVREVNSVLISGINGEFADEVQIERCLSAGWSHSVNYNKPAEAAHV